MRDKQNIYQNNEWEIKLTNYLQHLIRCNIKKKFNILLTGGRSAQRLYDVWASNSNFKKLRKINFYMGDERCIGHKKYGTNYYLTLNSLFKNGIPNGCKFYAINGERVGLNLESKRYAGAFPATIDLALFSIGDDGHIASLFPRSSFFRCHKKIYSVVRTDSGQKRITITKKGIQRISSSIIMAIGDKKYSTMNQTLKNKFNHNYYPANLVSNRTWIFTKDE